VGEWGSVFSPSTDVVSDPAPGAGVDERVWGFLSTDSGSDQAPGTESCSDGITDE
jgi:hypothetical protein